MGRLRDLGYIFAVTYGPPSILCPRTKARIPANLLRSIPTGTPWLRWLACQSEPQIQALYGPSVTEITSFNISGSDQQTRNRVSIGDILLGNPRPACQTETQIQALYGPSVTEISSFNISGSDHNTRIRVAIGDKLLGNPRLACQTEIG